MLDILPLLIFAGLLLTSALSDIASMKIPNWISIALAGLYPPLAFLYGVELSVIGFHLIAGFAILVLGFALFQFRILGGGDAKVLAAAATWTGFEAMPSFFYWTMLSGGVLAISLLMARKTMFPHPHFPGFVIRLLQPNCGIPYGVAIFVGGVAVLSQINPWSRALTLP